MYEVGYTFKTGNSVVRTLREGTLLEVAGPSTLEIVDLGVADPKPGDRFVSKYGPATVVGLTSRAGGVGGFNPDSQVLYIADGTVKVRFASKSAF
jgi:hypothetical protein